ncbi:MAG: hypothetical protein LAT81_11670 [Oceanicaulis sp.]|nr:hypothetical protein [Oceanicaulis sp.]
MGRKCDQAGDRLDSILRAARAGLHPSQPADAARLTAAADLCGPDEIALILKRLDSIHAAHDAAPAGDDEARDDARAASTHLSGVLAHLSADESGALAAGLTAAHPRTREAAARALQASGAADQIPALAQVMAGERNEAARHAMIHAYNALGRLSMPLERGPAREYSRLAHSVRPWPIARTLHVWLDSGQLWRRRGNHGAEQSIDLHDVTRFHVGDPELGLLAGARIETRQGVVFRLPARHWRMPNLHQHADSYGRLTAALARRIARANPDAVMTRGVTRRTQTAVLIGLGAYLAMSLGWVAWLAVMGGFRALDGLILLALGAIQLRYFWPVITADGPETINPDTL